MTITQDGDLPSPKEVSYKRTILVVTEPHHGWPAVTLVRPREAGEHVNNPEVMHSFERMVAVCQFRGGDAERTLAA
jgi:hypothetical protein